jgi:hypothetical protein
MKTNAKLACRCEWQQEAADATVSLCSCFAIRIFSGPQVRLRQIDDFVSAAI